MVFIPTIFKFTLKTVVIVASVSSIAGFCSSNPIHDIYAKSVNNFSESTRYVYNILHSYGLPSKDNIRTYSHFILSYNPSTRNPNWVGEVLDNNTRGNKNIDNTPSDRLKCDFFEESDIYLLHRPKLNAYRRSGYDRGHMAPAADCKSTQKSMCESFTILNITPQDPNLNRGFWSVLERNIRKISYLADRTIIYTGPLYLPKMINGENIVSYKVIGDPPISVPTHFFKVVLIESFTPNFSRKICCYVVPNQPVPEETKIETFATSLAQLEKYSGLRFFPELANQKTIDIEDTNFTVFPNYNYRINDVFKNQK